MDILKTEYVLLWGFQQVIIYIGGGLGTASRQIVIYGGANKLHVLPFTMLTERSSGQKKRPSETGKLWGSVTDLWWTFNYVGRLEVQS
jgi:hypothetical protein